MFECVFYCWRLFATGFCFAVFGLGGALFSVFVLPLLYIIVWDRRHRITFARTVIHQFFKSFAGLMRRLGILQVEFHGRERLNRTGLFILANHPTLIDSIFLMALVQYADCIVKADLQKNPFTRGAVNAAGYVFNDHVSELINDCTRSLQCGNNLIVFPEGTRTPSDGQIKLKRGAAHIAVRAQRNITPVLIMCQPKTLGKGEKWWKIPSCAVRFHIEVQEDIEIDQFIKSTSAATAARNLTMYLQDYFSERIQHHA